MYMPFVGDDNNSPLPISFVEAELFKNKGGWSVDTQFIDQMGSPYLLAHGLGEAVKDAVTDVFFNKQVFYYVWVLDKRLGNPIRRNLVNSMIAIAWKNS